MLNMVLTASVTCQQIKSNIIFNLTQKQKCRAVYTQNRIVDTGNTSFATKPVVVDHRDHDNLGLGKASGYQTQVGMSFTRSIGH